MRRSNGSIISSTWGVALVEVMPVNAFNGEHGWGYDGVGWFAVHEPYGGPDGFVRFVDACHDRGLGVIVDAVYNHLGPSGNYLPTFGPYFDRRSQQLGVDDQSRGRRLGRGARLHRGECVAVAARFRCRCPCSMRCTR